MTFESRDPCVGASPAVLARAAIGDSLTWTALLTIGAAGIVVLAQGWAAGWAAGRTALYLLLTSFALGLALAHRSRLPAATWLAERLGVFLLLFGAVGLALQAASGDPYVQPVIFLVPLVYAALYYRLAAVIAVGALYLGLMELGLWIGGMDAAIGFLMPLGSHALLMIILVAFTRQAVLQADARRTADLLAGDLERERDNLSRLAAITATLAANREPGAVLEQVVVAGRMLARAEHVRAWLFAADGALRPGASTPDAPDAPPSDAVRQAVRSGAAAVGEAVLALPLLVNGACIGALELDGRAEPVFGEADVRLLRPFADAAAVALANARLFAEASRSATLAERNRLARELHDTIAQGLTAVTMQLEAAQRGFERDPARARARLARAHELARATLDDVRASVWTLADPLIDAPRLAPALEDAAASFAERSGIACSYRHTGAMPSLSAAAATQLLRIAQEALLNVEKHARATVAAVETRTSDDGLWLEVSDNGVGFVAEAAANGGGFGLVSLRERARLAGGDLRIESAPGAGTSVVVRVPASAARTLERRPEAAALLEGQQ